MHLFSPEVGMLGTSGIVGPSILMAAGAAYGYKILKQDRVAVAFFGDGASNNGAFHEGLNLATIWDLPVIFVCENNLYATEVPFGNLKAVFFPQTEPDKQPDQADGSQLAVEFADGEIIRGIAHYNPERNGFFLFPLDRSKNDRIFVVNSAIMSIEVEKL